MTSRRIARECALQSLYYADSLKSAQENVLSDYTNTFKRELGDVYDFCNDLIRGTQKHQPEIDKLVSSYAKNWTVARMSAVDRSILRMATYEMVFSPERTPIPAVIDEAIELAKNTLPKIPANLLTAFWTNLKKNGNKYAAQGRN